MRLALVAVKLRMVLGSGRSPRSSALVSVWMATMLVVAGLGAGVGPRGRPAEGRTTLAAQVQTVTSYSPSDPLIAPAREGVAEVLAHARRFGSLRFAEVEAYVTEVYRLAPIVGLDPAIVISQSNLETDTWRTGYWAENLNPAGIGITADGAESFTWENGTDAARAQIVHLYLYAVGLIPVGNVLEPFIPLDPRYDAAIQAGYAGIARTVGDLTGRWAVDPNYGEKVAGRGNEMFLRIRPAAYAQSTGSSSAALADDTRATTAWATTANPPADPSFAWYDLGAVMSLGSIRWVFAENGLADQFEVQVSNDNASWATLGAFTNSAAGSWVNLETRASGRYLRFLFRNPNRDTKLGSLGEIQLWPQTSAPLPWLPAAGAPPVYVPGAGASPSPTSTPRPTATPTPSPTPIPSGPLAVTLSATRGTVNTWLGVTVTGFSAGQPIDVQWTGVTQAQVTAGGNGSAFVRIRVPAAPLGTYTVRAVSGSRSASATFTIAPRIKVIPATGGRGQTVDVSLRGFGKKETVRIRWRRGAGYAEVATVLTSNTGSANIDVAVPAWVPDGPTIVRGDGPAARAQTNAFIVTGGDLLAAEEAAPTTTATATPTATPVTSVTPTAEPPPTETPVIEAPTPQPTAPERATDTPTVEPTATETPPGTPIADPLGDGTPGTTEGQ